MYFVDKSLVLPTKVDLKFLITSGDVLHSWVITSLGVRMDAVPGRFYSIYTYIYKEGIFYGQCSEVCGVRHAYMPIIIKTLGLKNFLQFWQSSFFLDFFFYLKNYFKFSSVSSQISSNFFYNDILFFF